MSLGPLIATFALVFLGELPDKTMFASLILASRGRPLAVWIGAAAAFLVHVVLAVSVGQVLFDLLPHQLVDGLVAALFALGAIMSWRARRKEESTRSPRGAPRVATQVAVAAATIFVAEWGDLTQVIIANLALRFHDPLGVGIGALLALWAVAALAVTLGPRLLRRLSATTARTIGALVFAALAIWMVVETVLA